MGQARYRRSGRQLGRQAQCGAATIEYVVVTAIFVLALLAPTNTFADLMDAIKQIYQAFTFSISVTYPTPDFEL